MNEKKYMKTLEEYVKGHMDKDKIFNGEDKWIKEPKKLYEPYNPYKIKKKTIDDYIDRSPNKPLAEEAKESFLGFLHIDNETGEIYVKNIDGEKVVLESIDDIKKIATKKLLKK